MVWLIGPMPHALLKYLRRLLMLAEFEETLSKGEHRHGIV